MKEISWVDIVSCITAICTFGSTLFIGISINNIAKNIARIDKTQMSMSYAAHFYDTIMNNQEFYSIWHAIDEGRQIPNDAKKGSFIDVFEGLGDSYCNGLVYLKNIKTYNYMFEKTCQNEQIITLFKGKKNGFSLLCFDLGYTEGMGEAYNDNETCNILK